MSKSQVYLAIIVIAGFTGISVLYFFPQTQPDALPTMIKEHLGLITGWWGAAFMTVVNWAFGSSKGSADKTKALEKRGG